VKIVAIESFDLLAVGLIAFFGHGTNLLDQTGRRIYLSPKHGAYQFLI
jgi:hypothetical protein